MRVVFFSVWRGTLPYARSPWGTGVQGRQIDVAAALVHDHERLRGTVLDPLAVRRTGWLVALGGTHTLFSRPPQAPDGTAHGPLTHGRSVRRGPHLAVPLEGGITVGLHLGPQCLVVLGRDGPLAPR